MGVGSRNGALLGGRSFGGRAKHFRMSSFGTDLADVGEDTFGDATAFVVVVSVANPVGPGDTAM